MEAPKCRLCDERHFGPCPKFASDRSVAQRGDGVSHAAKTAGVATRSVRQKSTAARKDVHSKRNQVARPEPAAPTQKATGAGTQAPPVDTVYPPMNLNPEKVAADVAYAKTLAKAEASVAHLAPVTKAGIPRQRAPKGTFDRKAYQREAAKKRRAVKAKETH